GTGIVNPPGLHKALPLAQAGVIGDRDILLECRHVGAFIVTALLSLVAPGLGFGGSFSSSRNVFDRRLRLRHGRCRAGRGGRVWMICRSSRSWAVGRRLFFRGSAGCTLFRCCAYPWGGGRRSGMPLQLLLFASRRKRGRRSA